MKVKLRELSRCDLPTLNLWRNDPELISHLGANFFFVGPEVDEKWFEAYLASRDRAVRLAMVDYETSHTSSLLGVVYLADIHRINRTAEFGIMIGVKEAWSRGVGTAATKLALAHGFDDLNLHRVYLSVLAGNDRAIRLYEKVGFQHEGRQREAVFKAGRYHDVVLMSMLESEYRTSVLPGR